MWVSDVPTLPKGAMFVPGMARLQPSLVRLARDIDLGVIGGDGGGIACGGKSFGTLGGSAANGGGGADARLQGK